MIYDYAKKCLEDLKEYPELTAEQAKECSRIILDSKNQFSDEVLEAREKLVYANLKHAVYTALKYRGYQVNIQDLIQTAYTEMWAASATFDYSKGSFFNYAYMHMTKALRFIGITLPNLISIKGVINDLPRLIKVKRAFFQDNGYEPEVEELAIELGLKASKVAAILRAINPVYSVDYDKDQMMLARQMMY